ncbi:hypothetical protein BASA81_004469 [Batrachochytrium salamandrivorans]|nr:hypothetical protein BASA81_004469 [Batrachochytrium salamandrivorans]
MQAPPLLKLSKGVGCWAGVEVTCMAARLDCIAIGTREASVLVFDLSQLQTPCAKFSSGSKGVVDLGFDSSGDGLVVSDGDGSVLVLFRHPTTRTWEQKHSTPARFNSGPLHVAIDPMCYLSKHYAFAYQSSSSRKVEIAKRTWLGTRHEPVSSLGEGGEHGEEGSNCGKLVWRGDLLAWTASFNSVLVVHDTRLHHRVFRLELDRNMGDRHVLVWEDDETLLVGFANQVRIIRLKREADPMVRRTGNVMCKLDLPCAALHVCPFGGRNGKLVLFGVDHQVRLVERQGDGKVLCSLPFTSNAEGGGNCIIAHDNYWNASGSKLTVERETGLPLVFVVAEGGELDVLTSTNTEDGLQFALSNLDFPHALRIAKSLPVSLSEVQVLDLYVMHLISTQQFADLAQVLKPYNPQDLDWTRWSAILAQRRALHYVLDLLPEQLNPILLDCVLAELVEAKRFTESVLFVRANLTKFQHLDAIIAQLEQHPQELAAALALCESRLPAASLEHSFQAMLAQGDMADDAVEVLARAPTLWKDISDDALGQLFAKVETKAQSLLLRVDEHGALVLKVAAKLQQQNLLGEALRLVRRANKQNGRIHRELCDLEVRLCSQVEPLRLMELLRDTGNYSPDLALQLCRTAQLERETIYLLQRIGGRKHNLEALQRLLARKTDVQLALEFAEREQLVDELVELSSKRHDILLELVAKSSSSSSTLDPAQLVRDLPKDIAMDQLCPVLIELFRSLRANQIARRVSNQLFQTDASNMAKTMNRQFRRGVKINAQQHACALCGLELGNTNSLVVFRSKHVYHKHCLEDAYRDLKSSDLGGVVDIEAINSASLIKHHCLLFGGRRITD